MSSFNKKYNCKSVKTAILDDTVCSANDVTYVQYFFVVQSTRYLTKTFQTMKNSKAFTKIAK